MSNSVRRSSSNKGGIIQEKRNSQGNGKGPMRGEGVLSAQRDRRFSIISADDDDDDDVSEESGDDDNSEEYRNRMIFDKAQREVDAIIGSNSERSYPDSSSNFSSDDDDDDNVDFVELTKLKRARAMKAAKRIRYGRNAQKNISKQVPTFDQSIDPKDEVSDSNPELVNGGSSELEVAIPVEEQELDDSLVDAVILEEEKRLPELYESSSTALTSDENCKESVRNPDDLIDLGFDFEFVQKKSEEPILPNPIEQLTNEDLGEAVQELPQVEAKVSDEPVTLVVPKIDETELNSDADYDFDPDELIQALQNDDDELELLGNSDEDYNNFLRAGNIDISSDADGSTNLRGSYLTKEETQAMVKELENKESITDGYVDEVGDGDNDKDNDDEEEEEEEEENYAAGEDNDDDDDDDDSLDILGFRDIFGGDKLPRGSLYVPQSALFSGDEEVDVLSDDENEDFSSDNGDDDDVDNNDSEDDTNLLHYFFSSSSSESEADETTMSAEGENRIQEEAAQTDSEVTDEDTNLRPKSIHMLGSKRAKEVLSSSKNNFRAPKLGTFLVSRFKKPFGIIDGYSTRFLYPKGSKLSVLKGTLAPLDNTKGLTKEQRQLLQQKTQKQAQVGGSRMNPSVSIDELLNISEFEDDAKVVDNEGSNNSRWDSFFSKKRVPLTAFRNRGLLNNGIANNYADATRKYTFQTDSSMVRGPHRHRHHRHHHRCTEDHNDGTLLKKKLGSKLKVETKNSKNPKGSKNSKNSKNSKKIGFRKDSDFGDEFVIGVKEPLKLKKGSKKRMGRKSIVEAQAEGYRATKSGLFNEDVLNDVESLLMDIGAAEDYNVLFSTEK
ncbi:hypothetical protein FOA43_001088 [Brettanomyces nanus]|uniref:Protein IFH1 n=1 Tax=Eeniella nana TaxID=13502 RepID=A0A875S379_EENNA|nr:uncharacterized protein FOA43_001088 [Brettanomyces nanus]QPG73774.1 hypothetical protein FOA43_001088 [Brettanomyces nanus]